MNQTATIPRFSRESLKQYAIQFVSNSGVNFYPHQYFDVDTCLDYLNKRDQLLYKEGHCGMMGGHKILGMMVPNENTIYIDGSLKEFPESKRFTQVHEIGHWLIHRQLDLPDYQIPDTKETLNMTRPLETTYDWIEWQANSLAACLLVPENDCLQMLIKGKKLLHIHQSLQLMSPSEYSKLLKMLAYTFMVSQTVMNISLKQLSKLHPLV